MIPSVPTIETSKYEAIFALVSTMTIGAAIGIGWGLYRIKKEKTKNQKDE